MGEPLEELKNFDYFHELIMIDGAPLSAEPVPCALHPPSVSASESRKLTKPSLALLPGSAELSRCGSGGVLWGLFGGLSIGAPASAQTRLLNSLRPRRLHRA